MTLKMSFKGRISWTVYQEKNVNRVPYKEKVFKDL